MLQHNWVPASLAHWFAAISFSAFRGSGARSGLCFVRLDLTSSLIISRGLLYSTEDTVRTCGVRRTQLQNTVAGKVDNELLNVV